MLFATCFSALMSALSPALAQTLTPAQRADQEAIRQQERERQLRFQQERRPDVRLRLPTVVDEKDRLLPEETPCFFIERVVLKGDKDEATALFQWALPYAHHTPAGAPDPGSPSIQDRMGGCDRSGGDGAFLSGRACMSRRVLSLGRPKAMMGEPVTMSATPASAAAVASVVERTRASGPMPSAMALATEAVLPQYDS